MSLNRKQAAFTLNMAKLIVWASKRGIDLIGAELFRTAEQAEIYAREGKGIKNSVHRLKLAIDLFRLMDGKITWRKEDYAALGAYWKTLHPQNRWGGDFSTIRDPVHFSMEHRGVK